MESGHIKATSDFSAVSELDTINIAVPTPLRKTKDPDMTFIDSACTEIGRHFKAGKLVILEVDHLPGHYRPKWFCQCWRRTGCG